MRQIQSLARLELWQYTWPERLLQTIKPRYQIKLLGSIRGDIDYVYRSSSLALEMASLGPQGGQAAQGKYGRRARSASLSSESSGGEC